jgi:hypothetical protein
MKACNQCYIWVSSSSTFLYSVVCKTYIHANDAEATNRGREAEGRASGERDGGLLYCRSMSPLARSRLVRVQLPKSGLLEKGHSMKD